MDRSFGIDIAIFDFSKAFDSVPHCRLFSKLRLLSQYGICDTVQNWLHSFLSDQYQRVVVNSAQSSWLHLIRHSPRYRFGSTRACQQYISQGYQNSQLHTSQCVLLSSWYKGYSLHFFGSSTSRICSSCLPIITLLVIIDSWRRCSVGLTHFVKQDYKSTTSVSSLISILGWQTLSYRRRNSRLSFMYKSLHSLAGISTSPFRCPLRPPIQLMMTHFVSCVLVLILISTPSILAQLLIGMPSRHLWSLVLPFIRSAVPYVPARSNSI